MHQSYVKRSERGRKIKLGELAARRAAPIISQFLTARSCSQSPQLRAQISRTTSRTRSRSNAASASCRPVLLIDPSRLRQRGRCGDEVARSGFSDAAITPSASRDHRSFLQGRSPCQLGSVPSATRLSASGTSPRSRCCRRSPTPGAIRASSRWSAMMRTKRRELSRSTTSNTPTTYASIDECLEQVDAVYIALPNSLHAEYTVRAAARACTSSARNRWRSPSKSASG